MGNLNPQANWVDVPHFEANAVLTGGPDCPDNIPIKALADRTEYLKGRADAGDGALNTHKNAADPHPQYRPGRLLNIQVFEASGVYTSTPGTKGRWVRVRGAGGGGGGAPSTTAAEISISGGGGGGGYAESWIVGEIINPVTCTIAEGGAGGAAGSNSGQAAGTTSFGTYLSATGGSGGLGGQKNATTANVLSNPGVGGTATGGNICNVAGSAGVVGVQIGVQIQFGAGGTAGNGARSGGNGCQIGINAAARAGENGVRGHIEIWEFA